jgi:hypothetical protein
MVKSTNLSLLLVCLAYNRCDFVVVVEIIYKQIGNLACGL